MDKDEKNERLERLRLREPDDRPRCIHCGMPFDPHTSTGGHVGVCQSCID